MPLPHRWWQGGRKSPLFPSPLPFFFHNLKVTQHQIDCTAVAKARGISNPRSIANRIATFRSKTGIPLVAGNTSGKVDDVKSGSSNDVKPGGSNSSNGGSGGDTASPVKRTPKRKAPARAKTSRAKKIKATATPAESESEAKVEESASQESAVAVEAEVEAEIVRD